MRMGRKIFRPYVTLHPSHFILPTSPLKPVFAISETRPLPESRTNNLPARSECDTPGKLERHRTLSRIGTAQRACNTARIEVKHHNCDGVLYPLQLTCALALHTAPRAAIKHLRPLPFENCQTCRTPRSDHFRYRTHKLPCGLLLQSPKAAANCQPHIQTRQNCDQRGYTYRSAPVDRHRYRSPKSHLHPTRQYH